MQAGGSKQQGCLQTLIPDIESVSAIALQNKVPQTSTTNLSHSRFRFALTADKLQTMSEDAPRKRSRFDQTEPEPRKASRFDRRSRSPSARQSESRRSRSPIESKSPPIHKDRQVHVAPVDAASAAGEDMTCDDTLHVLTEVVAAAAARINADLQNRKGIQHVDVPPIQSQSVRVKSMRYAVCTHTAQTTSPSPAPPPKASSGVSVSKVDGDIYIADGDYIKDIEVNDLRNRYTLTKGSTQKMVNILLSCLH